MDNRVIGITIAVIAIAAYIKGIPQKLYALVRTGSRTTLSDVIGSAVQNPNAAPGDTTPRGPGAVANSIPDQILPGTTNSGPSAAGSNIAQIIAFHLAALQNVVLDPALEAIVVQIPASNDSRIDSWRQAFRDCYASGGMANYCAGQATQLTGMSVFG